MNHIFTTTQRIGLPLSASFLGGHGFTRCEEKAPAADKLSGDKKPKEEYFQGLFPLRQLQTPKVPYPQWDSAWDGKQAESTGDKAADRERQRYLRKHGVTRHIVLIRHGQYDETYKEDEKRVLTPLGREQADMTGKRLAEMMRGAGNGFGPCEVTKLCVSDMVRAKETATIISKHLVGVRFFEPDPLLNEGRPCHHIPGGKATEKMITAMDENHPRIEQAFQKYFYRAEPPEEPQEGEDPPKERHEFEIYVCHANVIRYFVMRALQLPPEAWLRFCPFNCSMTYLTIRPTGSVSCRMLGDTGHLSYNASTFSKHHGYNW